MPSLKRPATLESVRSWWSDRNLPGATINLHAASKPLMKFMYHRQALDFMRKTGRSQLTPEHMDVYSSYLADKYVSDWTKIAILRELKQRTESNDAAHSVVHSHMFPTLPAFLESSDALLVALLRTSNSVDVLYALGAITHSQTGAQAALDAQVLHNAAESLASPNSEVRRLMCTILVHLGSHQATALSTCEQLAEIIRESNAHTQQVAVQTLCAITTAVVGAEAAMETEILRHIPPLLLSPDNKIRNDTQRLLGNLASHESLSLIICQELIVLLCIAMTGAGDAVVDAGVLDHVAELGILPNADVRRLTWTTLVPLSCSAKVQRVGTERRALSRQKH
ncbi:hypothetical protein C8R43DRAFT_964759 [Mycena crocata]|nr:hypothetical protein C8R43DRAFT_964759 [Mycena crocata]